MNIRPNTQQFDQRLRLSAVCELTGLGKSTIWELVRTGRYDFPKQIKLTNRVSVWKRSEIEAWLLKREQEAR